MAREPQSWLEVCAAARMLPDYPRPLPEVAALTGLTIERIQFLEAADRYQPHHCAIRTYHQFARRRCTKGAEHEGCCPGECERARAARRAWLACTEQPPDPE